MDIDYLFTCSHEELTQILEKEAEKIISEAPPENRERLKAVHNRARMQVEVSKNPVDAMVRTSKLMHDSFLKLREKLNELRGMA